MKKDKYNKEQPEIKGLSRFTDEINSFSDEVLEKMSKEMRWGTYGPDGKHELKYKRLCDLDKDHIENIVVTQSHVGPVMKKVFVYLLKKK